MTLQALFYKYLEEDITPEELRLFREMATREENRAELNRLFAQWIGHDFPFTEPEEIDVEAMYLELTRKNNIPRAADVADEPRLRRPLLFSKRRMFITGTALAAACVLVVTSLFLVQRRPSPIVHPLAKAGSAAVPGAATNKAILTLADGRRIVLDSAANGRLAVQGSMQVVKLAGGRLVYRDGAGKPVGDEAGGYNVMTTPRGGYYRLLLPDGTKVWLDAASSLRYPTAFMGKDRPVELTGEAYFEVAPNKDQPFLVTSNGVTVQVLGTEFNIMAYSDEDAIRTTLVKGSVRVLCSNGLEQIRPGEQASWMRKGGALQLSTPDLDRVLAWKQGEFRFQGMPISAIMRQVSRWYDVDVEFKGALPATEFNGVISRKKDVAELLTVLEQTEDARFSIQGRKIIVESAAR